MSLLYTNESICQVILSKKSPSLPGANRAYGLGDTLRTTAHRKNCHSPSDNLVGANHVSCPTSMRWSLLFYYYRAPRIHVCSAMSRQL